MLKNEIGAKSFKIEPYSLFHMAIELVVKDKPMIIHDDVIDSDIHQLESEGRIGKMENGVYHAPRPNMHGMLTCLRNNREYNSQEIESVCMGVCPHNMAHKVADDVSHLDDCWEHLFNADSLDGETKYVEYPV